MSGKSVGDLVQRFRPGEAGHDDRVAAVLGEAAQRLFALRVVGDFELAIFDAGFGLELFGAVEGRLVEGFVELAAEIVEHRRLDVLGERRDEKCGCGQEAEDDTFHVIHTLSVVFYVGTLGMAGPRPSRGTWQGLSTLRSCAILHGQKQNSRGILTVWKSMPRAGYGTPIRFAKPS